MVKVYALIPRRPDVAVEKFHSHWRDVHAPLATRITTIRRYVQSHALRSAPAGLPEAEYEGIAEVWFDDLATAAGMGDDPNYINGAGADEPNFIDQSRLSFMFCDEQVLQRGPVLSADTPEVKVMLLLASPQSDSPWPPAVLADAALALPGIEGLSIALSTGDLYQADQPFDAVVELSWPSMAAYDSAWCSAPGEELARVLAAETALSSSAGMVTEPFRVIWP